MPFDTFNLSADMVYERSFVSRYVWLFERARWVAIAVACLDVKYICQRDVFKVARLQEHQGRHSLSVCSVAIAAP